jgi:glycosyltransferase involved in cell wall biosynthesis
MTGVSIMDACKRTKVPLIVHFHGYDAYQKNIIDSLLQSYKKLFEISSKIIAVSSDMKNQLINLGCPESKVFVNPCGATIRSELSKQINYNLQQFIMVGRLVEKKAPFVSIIAFSRVLEKYKHAKLEIIGDGHLLDACKQLVKSLNMRNNVVFYGSQEHSFVLEKMSKSSCFIQHSVTAESGDKEGTPVGVLEAMGMGLPVVSTKHGGISDIIEHTKTGFLVNEYDLDDMVKFMLEITNNVELAKSVGTAASDTVEKKYSLNHSISRLWSIISDAIEDKQ